MSYVDLLKKNGVLNAQGARSRAETEFYCRLSKQIIEAGSIRNCVFNCSSYGPCPYFNYWYPRVAGSGGKFDEVETTA
jgi:hypothetical protein